MRIWTLLIITISGFHLGFAQELPEGPANICLNRGYASTDELIYFHPTGLLVIEYQGVDLSKFGYWEFYNDTIYMTLNQIEGSRGVGKPVESVLTDGNGKRLETPNFPNEYKNYEFFVNEVDEYDKVPFVLVKENYINNLKDPNMKVNYPCSLAKEPTKLPGKYAFCSTRRISEADLTDKSKWQLKIMRNEIYARHGYKFKSVELDKYFSVYSWYQPTHENVDYLLSEIELENIKLIIRFENK